MVPTMVVLLGTFLIARSIGRLRGRSPTAPQAGRLALAALFFFTGISHFIFTAPMAEMVPPPLPPVATVWLTGVLEIAGAVGLLVPSTRRLAAWCLFVFLIAVFPANVYAAMNHAGVGGHTAGPSYLLPLQLLFLGWTWFFGLRSQQK